MISETFCYLHVYARYYFQSYVILDPVSKRSYSNMLTEYDIPLLLFMKFQ